MISFRTSQEIEDILAQSSQQLRSASCMAGWLIHQALMYPGVINDVVVHDEPLDGWKRMRLGPAAEARFHAHLPRGVCTSEYIRRLICAGDLIVRACECHVCAGFPSADRRASLVGARSMITRLDDDELAIAERITVSQGRHRISAVSMLVNLGLGQPSVDLPQQGQRRMSQRVIINPERLSSDGRSSTIQLRDLFHRGVAVMRSRSCCRQLFRPRNEAAGVFGDETPMPGSVEHRMLLNAINMGALR